MKPYNDYSSYLKEKYGSKVYRIALDARLSCPSRCVYCNQDGSRSSYTDPNDTIEKQLSKRIRYLKEAKGAEKFIAYFQAFTNTNADIAQLQSVYDAILPFERIVGLSIGTRPDCINKEKLALIASYSDKREVWIEYGLQSIHDRTLRAIKRGHDYNDFLKAYRLTREFPIRICAHVILGLPGETLDDMLQTAKALSALKIDGVKIHLLHIVRGSELEKLYNEGRIKVLEQSEYVDLACSFLENLSEDIIIQRLTGEGKREDHIAPMWALDKIGTINLIKEELKRRGSRQGKAIGTLLNPTP